MEFTRNFPLVTRVLSNLKTSFSGRASLPFASKKYADRYLGAFSYRFNRRFNSGGNDERVVHCPSELSSTAGTTPERCASFAYLIGACYELGRPGFNSGLKAGLAGSGGWCWCRAAPVGAVSTCSCAPSSIRWVDQWRVLLALAVLETGQARSGRAPLPRRPAGRGFWRLAWRRWRCCCLPPGPPSADLAANRQPGLSTARALIFVVPPGQTQRSPSGAPAAQRTGPQLQPGRPVKIQRLRAYPCRVIRPSGAPSGALLPGPMRAVGLPVALPG